jgi:hypothetical protein
LLHNNKGGENKMERKSITFNIECKGRDRRGNEVLPIPVKAKVRISQPFLNKTWIESNVDCINITGGHADRCKAEDPSKDKISEGIGCPYAFDLPYALEKANSDQR